MKTLKTLALATAVSAGLLGASGVMAFEDGQLNKTSTGKFDVRVVKDVDVQIWGFSDLFFNANANISSLSQDICLYSGSDRVNLEISSTSQDFSVSNGLSAGDALSYPYTVTISGNGMKAGVGYDGEGNPITGNYEAEKWGNIDGSSDGAASGATAKHPIVATFDKDLSCTGSTNRLNVKVDFGDSFNPAAGTYTDTVIMTVAAN